MRYIQRLWWIECFEFYSKKCWRILITFFEMFRIIKLFFILFISESRVKHIDDSNRCSCSHFKYYIFTMEYIFLYICRIICINQGILGVCLILIKIFYFVSFSKIHFSVKLLHIMFSVLHIYVLPSYIAVIIWIFKLFQ